VFVWIFLLFFFEPIQEWEGGGGKRTMQARLSNGPGGTSPNGPPIPPIYCSSRAAKGNGKCKRRRRKKGEEEEEGN
jgi:hypothetical protein